jgi:hypothetical protein
VKNHQPIALSQLSFPGYIGEPKTGERVGFHSLMHFFEAEKFRSHKPLLYQSIINSPSLREVAKLSKRHRTDWRDDWVGIRGRAMVCGMRYAAWADPNPERWMGDSSQLALELEGLGFPAKFCTAAIAEFRRMVDNPTWSFFGVDTAPLDVIGKRLNSLHRKYQRAWTLNHWLGRHTSWRLHDWALNQYVPMRYAGAPNARLTPAMIAQVVGSSNFTCVFEQRGGKLMDATIRQIKGLKVPLEMELYSSVTQASL